ncbi:MAG: D-2-hydroxyacid dehydrogenase [Acutalibacteraceae bacterium]
MKIVILDAYTTNPGDLSWSDFEKLGDFTAYDYTPANLTVERAQGAEIVITNKTLLPREVLERLPKLKYIGLLSTGYNVVDIDYAKSRGIPVCNVPTYSTYAVAQLTFALISEIYNNVALHNEAVHNGEWSDCRDFCFWKSPLINLQGKTIGIIGYGKIGSAVAKIADAYAMNILCYVPSKKPQPDFDNFRFTSLDELIRESDIISLHCPLTPETTGLVNEEFISKMKKSAIIINTSRGASVDETALAKALNEGRIFGAGVDVLSTEPPKKDNPLLSCERCIITPHIAWAGFETRQRLIGIVYDNLKSYLDGKTVNNVY